MQLEEYVIYCWKESVMCPCAPKAFGKPIWYSAFANGNPYKRN